MPSKTHGTLTIYTDVDTRGLKSGLNSITKTFNKLSSAMKLSVGIAGMLALGKSAVDAASDLKEYRNVAEVTFGKLIYMVNQLTDDSIEAYGMSKLMATQAASGFMAMGNAAGLAQKESAEMAIGLTKYMADFASFYNLSHERARTALAAVYTGETETLKQYGIMLQEVNLQQFENERGLGRSVKTMSAAEKVQLRYNYIMHVGRDAAGDFARTSDNWANQVKVLSERWKEFLIQLGGGLITVLTPLVKIMNQLIDVTMRYTRVLGESLATIFGIEWQELSNGYSSSADSANDYADAEDAIADATNKSTKSASKALQAFDKLNVIRTAEDLDTEKDVPVLDTGSFEDSADAITNSSGLIESAINSLYKLGQYMSESLKTTLDGIDWSEVYEKFSEFGTGVAEYLNGLFSVDSLSSVAETLGGSLNTIVEMAMGFLSEFDWSQFGRAVAKSISKFFKTFDAGQLAEALNEFVDGIKDALKAFIEAKPWKEVFSAIFDFLSNLEIDTVNLILGTILVTKIGKLLFGEISKLISKNIATHLTTALGATPVLSAIVLSLKALFGNKAAQATLINLFPRTAAAISGLTARVAAFFASIFGSKSVQNSLIYLSPNANNFFGGGLQGTIGGISASITNLRNNMSAFAKGAIGVAGVVTEFRNIKDAVSDVTSGTKDLDDVLFQIIATTGMVASAMYIAFGPAGIAFAAVAGIVGAVSGAIEGLAESVEKAKLESLFDVINEAGTVAMEDLTTAATTMMEGVTKDVGPTVEKLKSIGTAKEDINETVTSIENIKSAIETGAYTVEEKVPELIGYFNTLLTESKSIFEQEYAVIVGNIMGAWADVLNAQGQSVPAIVAALASMRDEGTKTFTSLETQLGNLIKDFEDGVIKEDEFLEKATPIIDQLIALNDTDVIGDASKEMNELIGVLDISDFMNGDTFDEDAFTKELQKVADAADRGKASLAEFGKESDKTITDMKRKLEVLNVDTSRFDWDALYAANVETINRGTAEIDAAYQEYADIIQYDVLKMLPEVIQSALDEYADLSWAEKLAAGSELMFVRDVIDNWSSTVFDPLSETLKDNLKSLGLDSNIWADDARNQIISALYTVNNIPGVEQNTASFNSNWKDALSTILSNYMDAYIPQGGLAGALNEQLFTTQDWTSLTQNAQGFGKNVVEGFNNGMTNEYDSTYRNVQNWMRSTKNSIHDSDMNFGSPSKTAMDFGKDTVVGYNMGLSSASDSTFAIINNWMTRLMNYLSSQIQPISTSMYNIFNGSMSNISSGLNNVLISMENSLTRTANAMYNTISGLLSDIESLLSQKSGLLDFMSNANGTQIPGSIISGFKVPMLATGAVIPPNRKFLAMLGDQKHGTNIEAPLDTIKQALAEVMSQFGGNGNSGDIIIQLNGREIARAVRDENNDYINRTGTSMFSY